MPHFQYTIILYFDRCWTRTMAFTEYPFASTRWRHQMETFSALLALCGGNSPVTPQRPVTQSFDVSFDLRLINGWVNNREAGDLRRHRSHYDATVMKWFEYIGAVLTNMNPDWLPEQTTLAAYIWATWVMPVYRLSRFHQPVLFWFSKAFRLLTKKSSTPERLTCVCAGFCFLRKGTNNTERLFMGIS